MPSHRSSLALADPNAATQGGVLYQSVPIRNETSCERRTGTNVVRASPSSGVGVQRSRIGPSSDVPNGGGGRLRVLSLQRALCGDLAEIVVDFTPNVEAALGDLVEEAVAGQYVFGNVGAAAGDGLLPREV